MEEDPEVGSPLALAKRNATRFYLNLLVDLTYYFECRDKQIPLRTAFKNLKKTMDCRRKPTLGDC
jgi:hypothetical protein